MASVNISEEDFRVAFAGAHACKSVGDDDDGAKALDKLARKINAVMSADTALKASGPLGRRPRTNWKDMPSVFDTQ